MGKKINEATSTDLPVILRLVNEYHWKIEDTLLYQQSYEIPENLKKDYSTLKSIKPDIVLQDLNGEVLAVIENNLDRENKDLLKLRTVITQLLKPRFLYACSAERILFYDNAWRGLDAGEFKQVTTFMTLEEMKLKVEQQKKISSSKEISIDTTIAGGFDPTVGKERYYQLACIRKIIENYKAGKQKMLIHMATGLGKTRTAVALVKALLSSGLTKRILFVVDRRMLAKQAVDDGFALISKEHTSSWITTKIIDNLPIEEAKRIFEEELKKTEVPVMKELKQKAADDNYQPSDEEIKKFIDWLAKPNIFLDEGHLQKMYDYKEGSAWDFLLHALGKKKIPTPKERIEKSYLSYIHTYNFTDEQIIVLKKIKDVFTSNVASQKNIDEKEIFGNPVYERLIGSYESINKLFEGKFNEVINDLKIAFGNKLNA